MSEITRCAFCCCVYDEAKSRAHYKGFCSSACQDAFAAKHFNLKKMEEASYREKGSTANPRVNLHKVGFFEKLESEKAKIKEIFAKKDSEEG